MYRASHHYLAWIRFPKTLNPKPLEFTVEMRDSREDAPGGRNTYGIGTQTFQNPLINEYTLNFFLRNMP